MARTQGALSLIHGAHEEFLVPENNLLLFLSLQAVDWIPVVLCSPTRPLSHTVKAPMLLVHPAGGSGRSSLLLLMVGVFWVKLNLWRWKMKPVHKWQKLQFLWAPLEGDSKTEPVSTSSLVLKGPISQHWKEHLNPTKWFRTLPEVYHNYKVVNFFITQPPGQVSFGITSIFNEWNSNVYLVVIRLKFWQ